MKLYMVEHNPNGKQYLFCDARQEQDMPLAIGQSVIVETMRGIAGGVVVNGPLAVQDGMESQAALMFNAYLPIRPILAKGTLPTDLSGGAVKTLERTCEWLHIMRVGQGWDIMASAKAGYYKAGGGTLHDAMVDLQTKIDRDDMPFEM